MGQGRRATARIAAFLALLLLLHHPLMGLMPMTPATGLSGQGMGPAMAASSSVMPPVGASAAVAATGAAMGTATGTQAISDCAACAMTCPLMNGIMPGRPALRSPSAQRDGQAPWPPLAAVGAPSMPPFVARNLAARIAGPIPDQRTRRAILQVYLL